jgi:hypothetical protein
MYTSICVKELNQNSFFSTGLVLNIVRVLFCSAHNSILELRLRKEYNICIEYTTTQMTHHIKKIVQRGVRSPSWYCIKKKTLSHRSRKSPNSCPTHSQRNRNTCEIRLTLGLCFGAGQTRDFFTTA